MQINLKVYTVHIFEKWSIYFSNQNIWELTQANKDKEGKRHKQNDYRETGY